MREADEHRLFTPNQKETAMIRQDFMCGGGCGKDLWRAKGHDTQGHHIVPYAMGGSLELDNLVILCQECHSKFDMLAITGTVYPGQPLATAEPEMIDDAGKFARSRLLAGRNRQNRGIMKKVYQWEYELAA